MDNLSFSSSTAAAAPPHTSRTADAAPKRAQPSRASVAHGNVSEATEREREPLTARASACIPACTSPIGLSFTDVSFWTSTGVQLLHSVTGFVNPGELVAIMGPSGSGKTTCLNALANRELAKGGALAGNIFVNGARRARQAQPL